MNFRKTLKYSFFFIYILYSFINLFFSDSKFLGYFFSASILHNFVFLFDFDLTLESRPTDLIQVFCFLYERIELAKLR